MLQLEARKLFRANGLIDDFVIYGAAGDYEEFAKAVESALSEKTPIKLATSSSISVEISLGKGEETELFTSLQNARNEYLSMEDWEGRNILRVVGGKQALQELYLFLGTLATRKEGYSYLSEYSKSHTYSSISPEVRLHVENT